MIAIHSFTRILIVAPHTDDGELACGASINKWVNEGKTIYYVAFSAAEDSVPEGFPRDALRKEVLLATCTLGISPQNVRILKYPVRRFPEYRQDILEDLVTIKKELQPNLVLLPSQNDIHQDHQVVTLEGIRAFKTHSVLGYELPWNQLKTSNTCFSVITRENLIKKYEALKCYQTQQHRPYLKDDFIHGWARMRGTQVGLEYAECFEIIRWFL
ncbi:PIG-L deacetylase family protein [Aneurinibacillus terranovensis]|uniref:PIG-L deacetylase family protein n=1 Tax=Aneurinibacillus terranovensis TaxID=278991 RepID=UPI00040BC4EA|nr:PIG-L family deacetylase [Aneurinibacillus terranovensis]